MKKDDGMKTNSGKVCFLSHVMSEGTSLYGGDRSISLRRERSIPRGDHCNTMRWSFPNHSGTHVDAPLHFMETGAAVPDFGPGDWVFVKVFLAEVSDAEPGRMIGREDLKALADCEILLIRTGFEKYRSGNIYWQESPGLRPDLAGHLKRSCPSIRAVGMDFISVSSLKDRETGRRAHRSFLENGILLIEDMKLSPLVKAPKKIVVAPLLVEGADGSPCTVFAMEE